MDASASGPQCHASVRTPSQRTQPEAADVWCVATMILAINIVAKRTKVETKERLYRLYHGLGPGLQQDPNQYYVYHVFWPWVAKSQSWLQNMIFY
jgi:hypothetical protein